MNRLVTSVFAFALGLSCMGCVSRTITRFEDNPKGPVTALELNKNTHFLGRTFSSIHQFYLCQDTGDKLVCNISCDGKNEAVCPALFTSNTGTTSNVR